MAKQKFYVVWKGVNPGIYSSWTDCQLQIQGYKGAIYKSFDSQEEAEHAFATPAYQYMNLIVHRLQKKPRHNSPKTST